MEWEIFVTLAEWGFFCGIVHTDNFVWLKFVHERFSMSEQTLNAHTHISVDNIT